MSNFLRRSAQGAGVPHEKGTSNLETVAMPLPSKIVLSMGQHIGAPAAPAVAKGDQVYVGTVVGKAGGFVSADIHSGVSGTRDRDHHHYRAQRRGPARPWSSPLTASRRWTPPSPPRR